jgi:DNA ligase (NAD+)
VLAEEYSGIEEIEQADLDELTAIREIGPKVAESIHTFFREQRNIDVIADLMKLGVQYGRPKAAGGTLTGKTFVFTGALKGFSRSEAKQLVEGLGGRVALGISRKVDYVVVGEDPGSKLDQAMELGIETIDEKAFKGMIAS